MSVYYRFVHERLDSYRSLELNVNSIKTSDLKVLVAEHAGLGKEYTRLFDLRVYDTEEKEVYPDEKLIPVYSRVVIQRIPWRELKEIHHEAQRSINIAEDQEDELESKLTLPSEYICKLCNCPLINPVLIKCAGSCGTSACRDCVQRYLEKNKNVAVKACPACNQRFRGSVPNKSLANILATIDWDQFIFPIRNKSDIEKNQLNNNLETNANLKSDDPNSVKQHEVITLFNSKDADKPKTVEIDPNSHTMITQSTDIKHNLTHINASAEIDASYIEDSVQNIVLSDNADFRSAESIPINISSMQDQVLESTIKSGFIKPHGIKTQSIIPQPHNRIGISTTISHAIHQQYIDAWGTSGTGFPYGTDPNSAYVPTYPNTFSHTFPYGIPHVMTQSAYPYPTHTAHYQSPSEIIFPVCNPYLTEKQKIQISMSFPLLSKEIFLLIQQAQQRIKEIWNLLPKPIRCSLLKESDSAGSSSDKKIKLQRKRKDYTAKNSTLKKRFTVDC
ncbi:zinc finger, C3HC4 type domain-containing protein [Cryptosporidium serpentis]